MNVLWEEALGFDLAWFCSEEDAKRPEVIGCLASNGWKALGKILISQRKKSKISWIRWLRPMQNWPNIVKRRKIEYNKLYHPYEWADFKALVPELPSIPSLQKWSGRSARYYHCSEERFWKEFAPNSTQQPTGKPFMPSCNSVQLFLGRLSWLKESVSYLSEYSRTITGTPEASERRNRSGLGGRAL